jgi:hypothetical protein
MAAVYSRLFFSGTYGPGQTPSIGPDPGFAWVIRDITFYSNASPPPEDSVVHVQDALTGITWAYFAKKATDLDTQGYGQWQGRQVFEGTGFSFDVSGHDVDIRVSGYQLTLP